jgi:hypothetical protein
MEWVTMAMEYCCLSSSIRSSMMAVAMGSRARAGFVHQDDFGADGDGAGDAQALLLATGQAGARLVHAVLDFFPQTGFAQGGFDDLVQFGLVLGQAVNARAVGHVVVDGFREGVGFLKDHADLGPQGDHIDILAVHIDAVQGDLPVTRQVSMVSFMRFRHRRKVDLPHPEGPIMAMTSLRPISSDTFLMACLSP